MAGVKSHLQLLGSSDYVKGAIGRRGTASWVVIAPRIESWHAQKAGKVDGVVIARHFHASLQIRLIGITEQVRPSATTTMIIAGELTEGGEIGKQGANMWA